MFDGFSIHRIANKPSMLTCLLAFTLLLPGMNHAKAEATAASVQPVRPSTGVVQLSNHTPTKVTRGVATRVSHYNPEQKLRLALALQPPDMAGEEKFLKEITTKGSPNFHKFLSAAEWNKRFGPSVEQEQAVVDWAKSQGLTVTNRFDNRLLVDVEAPAGVIEKAFGVTLNNYKVDDEVDFSNDRDPVVPASLPIRSVMGLNSIQRMKGFMPLARKMKGPDYVPGPVFAKGAEGHTDGDPSKAPLKGAPRTRSEAALSAAANASVTAPLAAAPGVGTDSTTVDPSWVFDSEGYDFDALANLSHCCNLENNPNGAGPNTSIAIVTFGDFQNSDVLAFFNYYGYAAYFYRFVVDGSGGQPGVECHPGASGCPSIGQDDEAPGDVEYANAALNQHGSYLNTARTYVYEGANGYYNTYADLWNFVLSNGWAKVASTSYGDAEEDYSQYGFVNGTANGDIHPIFNAMVGQGMTLIAAAGDQGSAQDCGDAVQVNWPAADPDFVAAGGTGLTLDSYGNFVSEVAWTGDQWSGACANNWGGGGGGQSVYFGQNSWQSGLVSGATNRLVPDISLSADPDDTWEAYYYGGGWSRFDGTSIVAPELAGFFTMENAYLDFIGDKCGNGTAACTPLGNPGPFVYWDAGSGNSYHNPIYDITSGCNSNDDTTYWGLATFCAGTGYDQATGWGSFNAMQLAWGINWELLPAYGQPSVAFSGPGTGVWYNSNQQVNWTVSDAGSSGYPAPGVAGFTQGWDTIPADPYSEPHGGYGNSFYDGPEYPFATGGCLAFDANGCAGGSGQGCHTVQVEAWDNQGRTATSSYGPLCYDSVAPTISASTNPNTSGTIWVNKPVTITLSATDPGGSSASGIGATYYAVNTGACYPGQLNTCNTYGSPFTVSAQGQTYVYYFTEDRAGNFSSEPYLWVSIDTTAPVTTASLSGKLLSGSTYGSAVGITLSATDNLSGVAHTYYQLNGAATATYTGSAISDAKTGVNTIVYWSVDAAGNKESSHSLSFTIDSPTTATLVASPSPSTYGQSVKMTATITASLAGAGTPTGSVIFWNGATNLGTVTLSGGVASLSTAALPGGALTLQVTYVPTGYFVTTNSAPFDLTVKPAASATTVKTSLTPASYGQSVTFTATVTSTAGTPTGNVTFLASGSTLGTASLSGGVAKFTTTSTPLGTHSITASYAGSSNFATSTSSGVTEVVNPAATTTTFTSSSNPASFGAIITFTATVKSSTTGTPTGTVALLVNGVKEATATLSSGVAKIAYSALPVGSSSIKTEYLGSSDYVTSTSTAISEVVKPAPTTTTLSSSLNPAGYGENVTYKATVKSSTSGTPTGTVALLVNGVKEASATLSSGVATITYHALPLGTSSITAEYQGSSDYATSTSTALSEVTKANATTTQVTSSVNPSTAGQSVTFTATVSSASTDYATGTVTFYSNGTSIGTGSLTNGVAKLTTTKLAVGTDSIKAIYAGNADFLTSTSAALSQKVN